MTLRPDIHKNILVQILIDIYSDTSISPYLGFKGGTAAYLFYGLERFSVDLDLDLLDEAQEKNVFEKVEKIVKKYGTIKDATQKRFNLFYLLAYDNKEKNAQNIKVEINLRSFGSKYEVRSFNGISMLVMIKEDMFAHKLVAMHERLGETNRDIFDVWFFSKNNWEINKEIVEARTKMSYIDFLKLCILELEDMNNSNILSGIGELLNEKQKAWAKSSLKLETVIQLKLRLESENKTRA
jgi:predicted nucleotidyltransferase component of viral defense system